MMKTLRGILQQVIRRQGRIGHVWLKRGNRSPAATRERETVGQILPGCLSGAREEAPSARISG